MSSSSALVILLLMKAAAKKRGEGAACAGRKTIVGEALQEPLLDIVSGQYRNTSPECRLGDMQPWATCRCRQLSTNVPVIYLCP